MRSRIRRVTEKTWHLLMWIGVAFLAGCSSENVPAPPGEPSQTQNQSQEISDRDDSRDRHVPTASSDRPTFDRDRKIHRADQLMSDGDIRGASAVLKELLVSAPGDAQVLFRYAALSATEGRLSEAVELLDSIPIDAPEVGLAALGQSADWCLQLGRNDDAEERFLRLLQAAPHASRAHRQLADLLFRQGRRHEAARHVRLLCAEGDIRQDELSSLLVVADAPTDDDVPTEAKVTATNQAVSPETPIAPGGSARLLFGQSKFREAADQLHSLVASDTAPPSLLALYGRAVVESQDEERYQWWLSRTDSRTREFSEYWAAVGAFELSQRHFETATRALAEAIDRDSTDYASMGRIRQALITLGDEATAQRWSDRWLAVRATMNASNQIADSETPDPEAIDDLAEKLSRLGRRLEAVLWMSIANHYRNAPPSELKSSELQSLNDLRKNLVANQQGFPSQSERLCGMDLNRYPLPNLKADATVEHSSNAPPSVRPTDNASAADKPRLASFENVASKVGLNHTFDVASDPPGHQHTIYQTLGGGVAVLDYDLDGAADLYLAQGAADPPHFQGVRSNVLYRHVGDSITEVTDWAGAEENQYSIGLTAGDWNQDGFPDLVISNLGQDMLLINQGDGTFSRRPLSPPSSKGAPRSQGNQRSKNGTTTTRVPSSIAMADLTGDAIPDIFQTLYIDDPDLNRKPLVDAAGRVTEAVSPGEFASAADWLIKNDGAGGFSEVESFQWKESDVSSGLGVVVADFDGKPGNEIFVGNDLYPNQLWVADPESGKWFDVAPVLGCAFGFTGLATGSMGIATGDFDGNGAIDIHIANYENQNASLFMQRQGAFHDRYLQYRLDEPSFLWVGFGTQAIDYDNDGRLDLVVTNGHLDDTTANSAPYMQPPQLLGNLGDRFQVADVQDRSGYWDSSYLGRGLARLDFDRDGRTDFLITHIGQPSALLINKTETDHHWMQIRLVGTSSERDAIGTQIQLRLGDQTMTDWVTAGDGYLSRNEAVVSFGIGQATRIDEVNIRWPNGNTQSIRNVAADQRILVVEGQDEAWQTVIMIGKPDRFVRSDL